MNNHLLQDTLKKRRELFFKKLDDSGIQLGTIIVNGYQYDPLPISDTTNGIKYCKLKLPLNWRKRQYGFWFKDRIHVIEREPRKSYFYLVDHHTLNGNLPGDEWIASFLNSVQFSMVYYAVWTWITTLKSEGWRLKITDNCFTPLLEGLSDEEYDLEIIFTIEPVESHRCTNKLWISLFR